MYLFSRKFIGSILCAIFITTVFRVTVSQKRYVIPPGMDESRFPVSLYYIFIINNNYFIGTIMGC